MKKVYFSRAMDLFEFNEIEFQYNNVKVMMKNEGFELVNEFQLSNFVSIKADNPEICLSKEAEKVVANDLKKLKKADILLVDFTKDKHFYFGCICELVYAYLWKKEIVVYTGNTTNNSRLWLHYHVNHICKTFDEALDYIKNI